MRRTRSARFRRLTPSTVFLLAVMAATSRVGGVQSDRAPLPISGQTASHQDYVLKADAGVFFSIIKADKVADFEATMLKLKEALQSTQVPERKKQAAGWKVYKSIQPAPDGNPLYVVVVDPVVRGADYSPSSVFLETLGPSASDVLKTYVASYVKQSVLDLQLLADFSRP